MRKQGRGVFSYRISTFEVAPEHSLVGGVHAQLPVEQRLEKRLRLCLVRHDVRLVLCLFSFFLLVSLLCSSSKVDVLIAVPASRGCRGWQEDGESLEEVGRRCTDCGATPEVSPKYFISLLHSALWSCRVSFVDKKRREGFLVHKSNNYPCSLLRYLFVGVDNAN